jgi:hypothetical protein
MREVERRVRRMEACIFALGRSRKRSVEVLR